MLNWNFLLCFLLPQKTVDCMTTMSVPSTLVKCLYLFFDLPHVPEVVGGAQNELPLAERRALLQKVFVQVRKVKLGQGICKRNVNTSCEQTLETSHLSQVLLFLDS